MNNNRGSNRRRGRGNNRQQGGNQANRIDSRARGNAPQLLEKYKKLAHDASLNGDRVQSEYYLQFADHYFRVIADSRSQRDEQRPPQQGNREGASPDDDFRDDDDHYHRTPRENGRETARDGRRERSNEGRREQTEREDEDRDGAEENRDEFEPADNPFVRESRGRGSAGDRPNRPRRQPAGKPVAAAREEDDDEAPRFDPASLPPSVSAVEAEEPKPRRTRARKPRASGGEKGGEELETVS